MDGITPFVLEYNKLIRQLVRKVSSIQRDAEIERIKKRLNIVVNATPFILIQYSARLWSHKSYIQDLYNEENQSFDWEKLKNLNSSDVILSTDRSHVNDEVNDIDCLFEKVKETLLAAKEDERIEIYDDLMETLSVIAKYRKYCKSNGIQYE